MNGNNNFEILWLYHPPPSDKNHHTNLQFINQLLDLYTQLSEKHPNMIITGNFNIHYFEEVNKAEQLKDMVEAMGVLQFVYFPTHILGNCLSLVFTEQIIRIKISNIRENMLLDHKTIVWDILLEKSEMKLDIISFTNWKNVDVEHFCNSLKLEELNDDENNELHEFLAQ